MKKIISLICACAMIFCFASCTATKDSQSGTAATAKKYVIATDKGFSPFEFQDANGNIVGIDMDILAAIAKDQNFEYDLQYIGLGRCNRSLPGRSGRRHDRRCFNHRRKKSFRLDFL